MKTSPRLASAEPRESRAHFICLMAKLQLNSQRHHCFVGNVHVTSGVAAGDFVHCIYSSNLSQRSVFELW